MIKVIGFDLDQTLYPKSPEIDRIIQLEIFEGIDQIKKCGLDKAERLFKKYYQEFGSGGKAIAEILSSKEKAREVATKALEEADIDEFLIPDQRLIRLLSDLGKKYYFLDLITGSPKKSMLYKIERLELPNIFRYCISGEQASKSNGEAYSLWLDLYEGFEPGQFLYIGDEKDRDYDVPSRLGIQTILVNVKDRDESVDCPQFSSIFEIRKILL